MYNKKGIKFKVCQSKPGDVRAIVAMINAEAASTGALLPVAKEELRAWIKNGLSFVAKVDGEIVGHEAAYIWPESGWAELRSAIVKPAFRGKGISSATTNAIMKKLTKKRGRITIVAFTNAAGTGRGILAKQGFSEISYHDMPKELFTIGPKYRGKSEFGYKMFVKHVTASPAKREKKQGSG